MTTRVPKKYSLENTPIQIVFSEFIDQFLHRQCTYELIHLIDLVDRHQITWRHFDCIIYV